MPERTPSPSPDYDIVDIAVSHDVDRYLLNTEEAFRMVVDAAALTTPLTRQEIMEAYARQKALRREGKITNGFNVVGYLEGELAARFPEYSWDEHILPEFVERGRENRKLLMPGAEDLIRALDDEGVRQVLLTYGSWSDELDDPGLDKKRSVKWQMGKIAATPILAAIPSHVSMHPYKSRFWSQERAVDIAQYSASIQRQWHQVVDGLIVPHGTEHDRGILLPVELADADGRQILARYVVQGDDKAIAFEELDPNLMSGVLVVPEDPENRMGYHHQTAGPADNQESVAVFHDLATARAHMTQQIRQMRGH